MSFVSFFLLQVVLKLVIKQNVHINKTVYFSVNDHFKRINKHIADDTILKKRGETITHFKKHNESKIEKTI